VLNPTRFIRGLLKASAAKRNQVLGIHVPNIAVLGISAMVDVQYALFGFVGTALMPISLQNRRL
jgi:hypothetical protein